MSWEIVIDEIGPRLGRKRLHVDEVMASAHPAVFQAFGELLVYIDGRLFDLGHDGASSAGRLCPPMLDPGILLHAAGIEYGWQHVEGCGCRFCRAQRALFEEPDDGAAEGEAA
jgi:hypothetical protein